MPNVSVFPETAHLKVERTIKIACQSGFKGDLLKGIFKWGYQSGSTAVWILSRGVEGIVVFVFQIQITRQDGHIETFIQRKVHFQASKESIGIVVRSREIATFSW